MGSDSRMITGFFATVSGTSCTQSVQTSMITLVPLVAARFGLTKIAPGTVAVFSRRNKHGRFNFYSLHNELQMQPLQWLAAWLFLWCGPGWRLLDWAGFANFSFKEVPLMSLVRYQNKASLFLQDCARIFTRSCRWSLNYRTAHCKVSELGFPYA